MRESHPPAWTAVFRSLLAIALLTNRVAVADGPPELPVDLSETRDKVGPDPVRGYDRIITPDNQILTPAGIHIPLPATRPQALALSPNGKILALGGRTGQLLICEAEKGTPVQLVAVAGADQNRQKPADNQLKADLKARISFTGLI